MQEANYVMLIAEVIGFMRYIKKDGVEAVAYTPEERKKVLDISLTALASSLGYTPVRAGSHYHLKEMDSLIIYNDRSWNRWSGKGNKTGGTQIDFMLEYGGAASVPEAIMNLLDFMGEGMAIASAPAPDENTLEKGNDGFSMELPPKNENYRRMYAYLIKTRGLSQEVVSDFVHRRLIYEDSVHHNIVYCGMDPEGNVRYAGLRGTGDIYGKTFKMDVPGNNKNFGVNIVNKDSDELKVFESVIDCMSYIDMYNDHESNKLILGMVEDNPMVQFLKDYSHIRKISFCLDNDEAAHIALYGRYDADGKLSRQGLVDKYKDQGYSVNVEVPEHGKDFNEMLQNKSEREGMEQQDQHFNYVAKQSRRHAR